MIRSTTAILDDGPTTGSTRTSTDGDDERGPHLATEAQRPRPSAERRAVRGVAPSDPATTVPSIVVIVSDEHAALLRTRIATDPTVTLFVQSEWLEAEQAILRRPPGLLLLDSTFVSTACGATMVSRVKANPRLARIDLRVLMIGETHRLLADDPVTALHVILVKTSQTLDHCGTRRALRVPIQGSLSVIVNGSRGQVIDLSVAGAQVLGPTRLRPKQELRLVLAAGLAEIRVRAVVAWAAAEPSGKQLRYRAGVEFIEPDASALLTLCAQHWTAHDCSENGSVAGSRRDACVGEGVTR